MNDDRPNPDELLARVAQEETRARRGKLRIFFGYAAGVGKTYAMLEAARRETRRRHRRRGRLRRAARAASKPNRCSTDWNRFRRVTFPIAA